MITFRQLGAAGLRWMLAQQESAEHREHRRHEYGRRACVLAESYEQLVFQRIVEVYRGVETHQALQKHLDAGINVLSQTARDLAFVYRRPPIRRIDIEGPVGLELNRRLARLNRQTRIRAKAKQWGQYAMAMNLVWVVPIVWQTSQGLRVEHYMVTPDRADRIHGANERDTEILLWERDTRENEQRGAYCYRQEPLHGWVLVDSEAYYWLSPTFDVEAVVPHNLGFLPATEFRVSEPPPDRFWDLGRGRKLVYATLESSRAGAMGAWVRSVQNRKLVTMFGAIGSVDRAQAATPENAVTGESDDKDAILFEVHDFDTAIDKFAGEQLWYQHSALESLGVPSAVFDEDRERSHAARRELREDQLDHVRPSEHELAVKTHAVAARFGHPDSIAPEIVEQSHVAEWQPMSGVDDPKDKLEVQRLKIQLGQLDQARAALEADPGLETLDNAQRFVMGNLERRAEVDLHYARHNLGPLLEQAEIRSVPQMQGAMGGAAARDQQPREQP